MYHVTTRLRDTLISNVIWMVIINVIPKWQRHLSLTNIEVTAQSEYLLFRSFIVCSAVLIWMNSHRSILLYFWSRQTHPPSDSSALTRSGRERGRSVFIHLQWPLSCALVSNMARFCLLQWCWWRIGSARRTARFWTTGWTRFCLRCCARSGKWAWTACPDREWL